LSQPASVSGGSRLTQAVLRGVREGLAFVLAAVALLFLLALVSYAAGDPSWDYSGDGQPVRNLIGSVGAVVAGALLFLFGRPAYLLPVMMLVAAWLIFRNRTEQFQPASRLNVLIRIGGFVLLLAASCGLAALHWEAGTLRASAGGVLGQEVGGGLAASMKLLGATLLLLGAWVAGLSIAFHVSLLDVFVRAANPSRGLLSAPTEPQLLL